MTGNVFKLFLKASDWLTKLVYQLDDLLFGRKRLELMSRLFISEKMPLIYAAAVCTQLAMAMLDIIRACIKTNLSK